MKDGLISVIIPCYNAEKYLDDCLQAILSQTYRNIEVIIVNDGSTDLSEMIIDSYITKFEDEGMSLIKINQENSGQAEAVNNALKRVSGEYLFWQDADDWIEKDAMESLSSYLNDHNLNVVRGEVYFRDGTDLSVIRHGKSKNPGEKDIFSAFVFETDTYCYAGIFMVRMAHFDQRIKNRQIYVTRGGQNWQLILPIIYNEECGYLPKVVSNIRVIKESHSRKAKTKREVLSRTALYEDILLHVLDSMDMPAGEKWGLKTKIRARFLAKKARIVLSSQLTHNIKVLILGKNRQ